MSPGAFLDMTPWEYQRAQTGYVRAWDDNARLHRLLLTLTYNLHAKKPAKPQELLPLLTDPKPKKVKVDAITQMEMIYRAFSYMDKSSPEEKAETERKLAEMKERKQERINGKEEHGLNYQGDVGSA